MDPPSVVDFNRNGNTAPPALPRKNPPSLRAAICFQLSGRFCIRNSELLEVHRRHAAAKFAVYAGAPSHSAGNRLSYRMEGAFLVSHLRESTSVRVGMFLAIPYPRNFHQEGCDVEEDSNWLGSGIWR